MTVVCPGCTGLRVVKNGRTKLGKQNFKCISCGRQFVFPSERGVSSEKRGIIKRLLEAGISVAVIASATEVSKNYVYGCRRENPGTLG